MHRQLLARPTTHTWQVLELVKYRYEPADFVKMILCNAVMLLALKQRFRSMIFLGAPRCAAAPAPPRAAPPRRTASHPVVPRRTPSHPVVPRRARAAPRRRLAPSLALP